MMNHTKISKKNTKTALKTIFFTKMAETRMAGINSMIKMCATPLYFLSLKMIGKIRGKYPI